jgi:hypothetical protein
VLSPRRQEPHSATAIIRDIVEVVAILAAGVWAIYTFVYVERIKPARDLPLLVMTGSLHKLGERKDFIQFSYDGVIRNEGHTRVYLIADGYSVTGFRLTANGTPISIRPYRGTLEYDRDARVDSEAVIYRRYSLRRYANSDFGGGYEFDPGDQIPFTGVFAVRSGEFDSIALYGSLAYGKELRNHPTRVLLTPDGAAYFAPTQNDPDYNSIEVTLDRASLW